MEQRRPAEPDPEPDAVVIAGHMAAEPEIDTRTRADGPDSDPESDNVMIAGHMAAEPEIDTQTRADGPDSDPESDNVMIAGRRSAVRQRAGGTPDTH